MLTITNENNITEYDGSQYIVYLTNSKEFEERPINILHYVNQKETLKDEDNLIFYNLLINLITTHLKEILFILVTETNFFENFHQCSHFYLRTESTTKIINKMKLIMIF